MMGAALKKVLPISRRIQLNSVHSTGACGGAAGLETELLDGTLRMANLLRTSGYPEKNLTVRIESWAEHNEDAWSRMTPHWLRFLFGRPQIPEDEPAATWGE